jgi:protein tyrosine/serine phosphatase
MQKRIEMSRRFKLTFFIIIPTSLLLLSISYVLYFEVQGNFHTITPGEAYRSAQLDGHKLEYYIKKYNIKSILSVRGDNKNAGWYRDEIKTCIDNCVVRYSVALSVEHEPSQTDIKKITEIFNKARRPVLIHCKAGADRTGLVAAMWKVIVDKEPKSEAEKQLSLMFFHFSIGRTASLDRFFKKWQP